MLGIQKQQFRISNVRLFLFCLVILPFVFFLLDISCTCKLKFFKLATDEKPFYQQWYRRPGDPEVCDHSVLSLMHDPDNTCASCRKPYLAKEDWLECKVCEQWFHERCFMNQQFSFRSFLELQLHFQNMIISQKSFQHSNCD